MARIEYKEEDCIGCGSCTNVCKENWELIEKDGGYKAKPKKTNISGKDIIKNKEAADVCPVNCIKVIE